MTGIVDVGGGLRGIYGAGVFDYCLDRGISFDYC
ncbi:MAG: patatin family protein, partial [Oscillospiraceae bacterium]|nr:patatin family protein [Oscillospiraceae bacterium]